MAQKERTRKKKQKEKKESFMNSLVKLFSSDKINTYINVQICVSICLLVNFFLLGFSWAGVDALANLAIKMNMKTLIINHKPDDVVRCSAKETHKMRRKNTELFDD